MGLFGHLLKIKKFPCQKNRGYTNYCTRKGVSEILLLEDEDRNENIFVVDIFPLTDVEFLQKYQIYLPLCTYYSRQYNVCTVHKGSPCGMARGRENIIWCLILSESFSHF